MTGSAADGTDPQTRALALLEGALADMGLDPARPAGPNLVVELPGERKLKTSCLLTAGRHGVRVEAFVCRRPDEDHVGVYRYLLSRNRRLYGVAYTVDRIGDIYLVGRISHDALSAAEIDRVLGQVLEAADGDFNTLLEIGFHSSIRREWRWRTVREEPLRNLDAFLHLITDEDRDAVARGQVRLDDETEASDPFDHRAPAPATGPDGPEPGAADTADGDRG